MFNISVYLDFTCFHLPLLCFAFTSFDCVILLSETYLYAVYFHEPGLKTLEITNRFSGYTVLSNSSIAAVVRTMHVPTSKTASHDNHENINSWVSFCFPYGYGALRGGPLGRWSSTIIGRNIPLLCFFS